MVTDKGVDLNLMEVWNPTKNHNHAQMVLEKVSEKYMLYAVVEKLIPIRENPYNGLDYYNDYSVEELILKTPRQKMEVVYEVLK